MEQMCHLWQSRVQPPNPMSLWPLLLLAPSRGAPWLPPQALLWTVLLPLSSAQHPLFHEAILQASQPQGLVYQQL